MARDESDHALIQWEAEKTNGSIGEAIVVAPGEFRGYAEDAANQLILAQAVAGRDAALLPRAPAGPRAAISPRRTTGSAYLASWARRLQSPIKIAKH